MILKLFIQTNLAHKKKKKTAHEVIFFLPFFPTVFKILNWSRNLDALQDIIMNIKQIF